MAKKGRMAMCSRVADPAVGYGPCPTDSASGLCPVSSILWAWPKWVLLLDSVQRGYWALLTGIYLLGST